jgi:hypothetical protein
VYNEAYIFNHYIEYYQRLVLARLYFKIIFARYFTILLLWVSFESIVKVDSLLNRG